MNQKNVLKHKIDQILELKEKVEEDEKAVQLVTAENID